MIEMELIGYNPVRFLFNRNGQEYTIKEMEDVYKILTLCKKKYPEWYKVVSETVNKIILSLMK